MERWRFAISESGDMGRRTKRDEEAERAFIDMMLGATLNLVRLDPSTRLPTNGCSGFVIERGSRHFLLSAGHGLRGDGWYLETTLTSRNREVLTIPLQPIWHLQQIEIRADDDSHVTEVDFAWVELELDKLEEQLRSDERIKGQSWAFKSYRRALDVEPTSSGIYGFAASSQMEYHRPIGALRREPSYELYMEYVGLDSSGLYRFKLAREHQGHAYYRGASGAPIADGNGQIVSMVLRGDEREGTILGLPLRKYQSVIGLE
ncbi:hypothetical protein [Polyangium spumosum]|uniref:Trypsin-like serine protease n=1 Tax=Polyangium spumosum TaxID=889282 RepID=A0A6N7PRL0_9BACT|nr:hypothetical protein [Polyangium spumosum]MRG94623.1 hypothetical protein [Polyangium spumosum]